MVVKAGLWVSLVPAKAAIWKDTKSGISLSAFAKETLSAKIPKGVDLSNIERAVATGTLVVSLRKPKTPVGFDVDGSDVPLETHLKKSVAEIKKMLVADKFSEFDLELLLSLELRKEEPRKALITLLTQYVKKTAVMHGIGRVKVTGKGEKKKPKVEVAYSFKRKTKTVAGKEIPVGEPADVDLKAAVAEEKAEHAKAAAIIGRIHE